MPQGWLKLSGVTRNNLRNVDAAFPLGVLTAVTGVSGSGKSSLVKAAHAEAVAQGLPLVLVDGVTAMTGRYPTRDQLASWAGLTAPVDTPATAPAAGAGLLTLTDTSGGCAPGAAAASGCC